MAEHILQRIHINHRRHNFADDGATLTIKNSTLQSDGGTLSSDYLNTPSQGLMVTPPWILVEPFHLLEDPSIRKGNGWVCLPGVLFITMLPGFFLAEGEDCAKQRGEKSADAFFLTHFDKIRKDGDQCTCDL